MRRMLVPVVSALAGVVAGCGADPAERFELTTPVERATADPLPAIKRARDEAERVANFRPTQRYAERVRPLLRAWGAALARDDYERAARYFAVPAIVAQASELKLETTEQIKAFNAALPCGARLLSVGHAGRFVLGTFRLTERPRHDCDAPGERVRVAFALRAGKISEWRQLEPGAQPDAARPEDAPEPPPVLRA